MNHDLFIEQCLEELRLKTGAHDRLWHLGEADWNINQDTEEVVFSTPGGVTATCPVQIIGTFNTEDSTWLWGWDHPSVQSPLRKHAERLREYGESNGIVELTSRKLATTEEKCWEFTALACKLNDSQGGYRAPSGSALVFITFGQPKLSGTSTGNPDASNDIVADKSPAEFTSDIPDDIRMRVIGFITALHDWEVESSQLFEAGRNPEASASIKRRYSELIRTWCTSDVVAQSLAFGSEPSHDPKKESLVTAAVSETECWVRTRHTNSTGFAADYEFHLRRVDGTWLVENLFYMVDGEKHECL